MRILAGLMTAGALAMTAAAWAAPPGITDKDGAFVAADGMPLYTYARDSAPGKSACNGQCAASWPPLTAAADAKADGDWSLVTRDDGSKQWAHKGKPLYTYAKDSAGAAATGVSDNWPLARK